jgi:hypothetical protein
MTGGSNGRSISQPGALEIKAELYHDPLVRKKGRAYMQERKTGRPLCEQLPAHPQEGRGLVATAGASGVYGLFRLVRVHPRHQHTVTGQASVGASHFPPGYSAATYQVPPVMLTKMSSKQPFSSVVTVR